MGKLFGTDGARGIVGEDLTTALAMNLGKAAAMVVGQKRQTSRPLFLIGQDTRLSGDMLTSAVAAGICAVGGDVILLGVLPTPAVAYLTQLYKADAGVMISASHNPYPYNGIKLFGAQGFKLTDEEEGEIEAIVLDNACPYTEKTGKEVGQISRKKGVHKDYLEHLAATIPGDLAGMRVLVDCANGSASTTARELLCDLLGADATFTHLTPDGVNINENCGSTHMERLGQAVVAGGYPLGIAFDGDADRCLAVDEKGDLVDGDMLMAIFALQQRKLGKLKGNQIVATVMSNYGFFQFAKAEGFETQVTKVGDRYVLERMREGGYNLGGEASGHLIFLDYMTTGDGQLSAVQLLSVLKESGKPLSQLAGVMKKLPQVLLGVKADAGRKQALDDSQEVQAVIEEQSRRLEGRGRILVRVSGTEPLIRVMAEGENLPEISDAATKIVEAIEGSI